MARTYMSTQGRPTTCPSTINYKNPSLHYISTPPRPFSVNLSKKKTSSQYSGLDHLHAIYSFLYPDSSTKICPSHVLNPLWEFKILSCSVAPGHWFCFFEGIGYDPRKPISPSFLSCWKMANVLETNS